MTDLELKNLKDRLWHSADMLRAGAHLAANKYGQPILGLIFLRYADILYKQHKKAIMAEYEKRRTRQIKESRQGHYLQSAYQNESSTEGSTLVFKTSPSHILLNYDTSEPYGRQIMWDEDYSIDLQLDFGQDGTVSAITMRSPAFLYNSLENNISSEQLSSMSSTEVQSAASLRDDILGNLAAAFENAVVNVNIDQQSGVIRLDNEVLFDVDSYELSDAGKAYLDSFISVYASALLDGSFAEQINHIEIAGHTDTNDTWEHNQVLSENRAKAVYDYCISSVNNGMDDTQKAAFAELTEEKGYSYSDPIFTDTGEIDMAASRRVEIRFFINV